MYIICHHSLIPNTIQNIIPKPKFRAAVLCSRTIDTCAFKLYRFTFVWIEKEKSCFHNNTQIVRFFFLRFIMPRA